MICLYVCLSTGNSGRLFWPSLVFSPPHPPSFFCPSLFLCFSSTHSFLFIVFSFCGGENISLSLSLFWDRLFKKREREEERKEKRDNIFLLFWLVTASSLFSATLHNVVFSKRLLLTRNRKSLVPPTRPPPQKRSILSFISFFFWMI